MGIEKELRKPMSYGAIQAFEGITRPNRLGKDATVYDIGFENAKAEIRDRLSAITGLTEADLALGVY